MLSALLHSTLTAALLVGGRAAHPAEESGEPSNPVEAVVPDYRQPASATALDLELRRRNLEQAVHAGNEELVLRSLALAPGEVPVAPGYPLVVSAIGYHRLDIARHLIDAGYDVHASDRHGQTALHLAASSGSRDSVQFLLDNGFVQVDAADDQGRTALLMSVVARRPAVAALLLNGSANPDIADNDGHSPLVIAVTKRYDQLVNLLLEHGADTRELFATARSPFRRVLEKGHVRIAERLVGYGRQEIVLEVDALNGLLGAGRLDSVQVLARAGHNLDHASKEGHSALAHAVQLRRPLAIQALLASGANPDATGRYGRSVLTRAVECLACLAALVEAGADVNHGGRRMTEHQNLAILSPLGWAVVARRPEAVEALLRAGADVHRPDTVNGRAPIALAARNHGMADMARLLVRYGADPQAVDADTWPALLHGAAYGDFDTVKALVDAGAEVNVANGHGRTPLMMATANGDLKMMMFLLERGAQINARSNRRWTALSEANHHGYFDLATVLELRGAVDPIEPPLRSSQDRGRFEIGTKVRD